MGFSCLVLVFVVQQLFGQSSAYLLIHGEPTNYVSAVGDPGMTNPNVRVALEAWNFCNEVGFEVPNVGSPRWADCTDLYCSSDSVYLGGGLVNNGSQCRVLHKVNETDNRLGAGDKFPIMGFESYADPDLFAKEKELYLGSLCEVQESPNPWQFWMIMVKNGNFDKNTTLYLSSLLLQANFFEAVFSDIGTGKQQFHGQMDYKAAGLYTLDEALETVGFGKFQGFVLGYAGLGWFAEAMEIMILSFIGQAVKSEWQLSSGQESLLSTIVFAGMLLGANTWGLLSDNYGRRKGFLTISMVTFGAGLLSTFSPNYLTLVLLRGLVGFGLGGSSVFLSWFLEFIPASNRGMWMVVFSTFWTFGSIFEATLAWIVMPRLNWRWVLAFSAVPSFALLILYGVAPESPRYLCMKGNTSDALRILEKIASVNQTKLPPGVLVSGRSNDKDEESAPSENTAPLLPSLSKSTTQSKSGFSSFFMLFSSKLIRTTLLLWVLFFGDSFSYYGIILLTSKLSSGQSTCFPSLQSNINPQDDGLYLNAFITSMAELPGLLLSAILVDRVGRKHSMAIMFGLAFIFLTPLLIQQPAVLTTCLLFGARMNAMGTFTVASIYSPELYPTSVRTTGAGVASAIGRIGGMVCPLVAVGLVNECHQTAAVALFLVAIVVSIVCIQLFPYDTKGRELSDTS